MKLNFWHGDIFLHTVDIEPTEDSALPRIVFVGNVVFRLHELTFESGEFVAQYQAESPMVIPASQAVNQHFFPSSPIKRN